MLVGVRRYRRPQRTSAEKLAVDFMRTTRLRVSRNAGRTESRFKTFRNALEDAKVRRVSQRVYSGSSDPFILARGTCFLLYESPRTCAQTYAYYKLVYNTPSPHTCKTPFGSRKSKEEKKRKYFFHDTVIDLEYRNSNFCEKPYTM